MLNRKSGVLGITGKYTDRRDIEIAAEKGDERCRLAIDVEGYRLKKYLGAYTAALGRVDAVVFTAGVGERGPITRAKCLEGLENLGIVMDPRKNDLSVTRNAETEITGKGSKVRIFVIPTDEELVMTEDTHALPEGHLRHAHEVHLFVPGARLHEQGAGRAARAEMEEKKGLAEVVVKLAGAKPRVAAKKPAAKSPLRRSPLGRSPPRKSRLRRRPGGAEPGREGRMHAFFESAKPVIAREIRRLARLYSRDLGTVNAWGPDALSRLAQFAEGGKMVRGGLLLLAASMHGAGRPRPVVSAAACIEILHSCLLVHDDIMDDDRLRRGAPTIFAQYERLARGRGARDAREFGRSMGICAGDVGYFVAWDALSRLPVDPGRRSALLSLVSGELARVGVAQMQDVALGSFSALPSADDVLTLYLYKTARYTFSLPLAAGALLAGAGAAEVEKLLALGARLGVVFQLRDDDLGVFGSRARTGKPVGSDVREGKKTLLYLELLRRARGTERRRLASLLGKKSLTAADLHTVRTAMVRLGARGKLAEVAEDLAREAAAIVRTLAAAPRYRSILAEICGQSVTRSA